MLKKKGSRKGKKRLKKELKEFKEWFYSEEGQKYFEDAEMSVVGKSVSETKDE